MLQTFRKEFPFFRSVERVSDGRTGGWRGLRAYREIGFRLVKPGERYLLLGITWEISDNGLVNKGLLYYRWESIRFPSLLLKNGNWGWRKGSLMDAGSY